MKRDAKITKALIGIMLIVTFCFTGCAAKNVNVSAATDAQDKYNWKTASENRVGNLAYRKAEACGQYHFDSEGKTYYDGIEKYGEWVRTDKKTFGEEYPNKWDIWCSYIEDSYGPGDLIGADIMIRIEGKDKTNCRDVYGSMYFADLNGTDGAIGENLIIREYFNKQVNADSYPVVEMSHFGRDNDGRDGSSEGSDGDLEYYYKPQAALPRLAAEGDEVYVVLDISDEDGEILKRNIWTYTFKVTDTAPKSMEADDYPYENDPDYERREHAGHWNMTDVRFIGGNGEIVTDGDVTITAERYGVEGQNMVYTFEGKDGAYQRIIIPDLYPETFKYAGDTAYLWHHVYNYQSEGTAPGLIHCSICLGDVDYESGKYGVKVTPEYYFEDFLKGRIEVFDVPAASGDDSNPAAWLGDEKGTRMNLSGDFPEGKKTGDKLYLCYGVMDGFSGKVRMYNIYEYTYTEGPDIEWFYNQPMPD